MSKNVSDLTDNEIVEGVASFGIRGLWRGDTDVLGIRLGLSDDPLVLKDFSIRLSRMLFNSNEFVKYHDGPFIALVIERRAKAFLELEAARRAAPVNPKPIAVALVRAFDSSTGAEGVLLLRRTDAKFNNMLALPGGYMELGETWKHSIVRELLEETGIERTEAQVLLHHVATSPLNGNLQVFGCLTGEVVDIRSLQPTPEASSYEIAGPGSFDTKFSTHQDAVRLYFERGGICL